MTQLSDQADLERFLTEKVPDVGEPALALAQFDHRVAFARVSPKGVEWPPDFAGDLNPDNLLDVRLFGPDGEWHIWRGRSYDFLERFRDDAQIGYMEESQTIWGTRARQVANGWFEITEERGISFLIPVRCRSDLRGPEAPQLSVRHYVDYEEDTGLAIVVDSRLAGLGQSKET